LSGGTFCDVLCLGRDADFDPLDYEEPRRSLANLCVSGERGCSRCHLLYGACEKLFPRLIEQASQVLARVNDFHGIVNIVFDDAGSERFVGDESVQLHYLVSEPEPDWISLPPFRPLLKARKAGCSNLIAGWLEDCVDNHSECKIKGTEHLLPLPARVIDVGNQTTDPFLYITNNKLGRYAALSHCWGKIPFLTTKKDTLEERRSGISMSSLPKNFTNAIEITRALGIPYIWIDSLCIIQDDSADWEVESSKMASVYQYAQVVLFASNSGDSRGGLWNPEWKSHVNPRQVGYRNPKKDQIIQLPYENMNGEFSTIIARTMIEHEDIVPGPYLEYESPSPLFTRAWGFQEQYLASRGVFFTGKELLWRCLSTQKCECMEEDNRRPVDEDMDFWERLHSPDKIKSFGGWRSLMSYYSKKNITYDSDRLPAISGIAKYVQSLGVGEYLAGFWKDDIYESLLWLPKRVIPPLAKGDSSRSTYRRRATDYHAPTWSWISLAKCDEEGEPDGGIEVCDWFENHSWTLSNVHAELVDSHIEPAGLDPTGKVRSAYLVLRAKMAEVSVCWENRHSIVSHGDLEFSVHWDIDLDLYEFHTVYALLVGHTPSGFPRGLILQESSEVDGAFERIGLFDTHEDYGGQDAIEIFADELDTIVKIV
jgi:hypothetical protein